MGGFTSPEQPSAYREDPLAKAQGGVRERRGARGEIAGSLARMREGFGGRALEVIDGYILAFRKAYPDDEGYSAVMKKAEDICRNITATLPAGADRDRIVAALEDQLSELMPGNEDQEAAA